MSVKRIGHKGADLIAPGNTLASFDAALDAGVDMIEFDVLPDRATETRRAAGCCSRTTTSEVASARRSASATGSRTSQRARSTGLELDVDLKIPGYELRVVDALRAHGLSTRTLISTTFRTACRLRAHEPRLRLGWSVPRARRDYTASTVYKLPAYAALQVMQRALPARAHEGAAGETLRRADGPLAARDAARWSRPSRRPAASCTSGRSTTAPRIRTLSAMGVTGIITNDPRLFS